MESSADSVEVKDAAAPKPNQAGKSFKFWAVFVAISLSGLLTAMEATITSTVLPDIIADLGGGNYYIWVVNGYFLSRQVPGPPHRYTLLASLQPMVGQLANVFGRRWPMIISTAAFVLGSGICGGANGIAMLIAGRVIQGIGSAGVNVLVETVICDLVPLRERGNYMAMLFGLISLGTALGPFFGGLIVTHSTWRWCFYISLPVGGPALAMLYTFLHVNYDKSSTLATKLSSLDYVGNAIFVGATASVLIALSWAGSVYPWSSFHVLVPLVVGMAGLAGFLVFEGSPWAANPMTPLHLFRNRTSATAFVLTFLQGLVTMWTIYFLPVYFQGVLGAAPDRSGVLLLPTILIIVPSAITGGVLLSKFGRYKPIFWIGFGIAAIGFGLFTLFTPNTNTGTVVGFQIVESIGTGMIIPALLPALMAPLEERDTALATGTWSFVRTFGTTWGIAISAAIFDNRADALARTPGVVTDPAIAAQLLGGNVYQHATAAFLDTLSPVSRAQFTRVLSDSLQRMWQVAIAFAAAGFLLVAVAKEVPLRKELESDFGIVETTKTKDEEKATL